MGSPSVLCQGIFLHIFAFLEGPILSMFGPTIPELAWVYHVELESLSFILLVFGVGCVLGQLAYPSLVKRIPIYLLMAAYLTILGIFYATLSTSVNMYTVYISTFFAGAVFLQSYTVILHKLNSLWTRKDRAVYTMFGITALGAVVIPLLLEPFLSDGAVTQMFRNIHNLTVRPSTNKIESVHVNSPSWNYVSNSSIIEDNCDGFISLIKVPCFILAGACIPCIAAFLYFFFIERTVCNDNPYEQIKDSSSSESFPDIATSPIKKSMLDKCFIFAMFLHISNNQCVTYSYSSLLATFGINSNINASLDHMTLMTSLFYFMFLAGRLLPCFLPSSARQIWIVIICAICQLASCIVLCFSFSDEVVLWITSVVLGFFTAPAIPAGIAWSREVVTVTSLETTIFLTALGVGSMSPYPCGLLMSKLENDWFMYFIFGVSTLDALVTTCLVVMTRKSSEE